MTANICKSIPGFYTLDDTALQCARGLYQPDSGQAVCLVCGHNDPASSYYSSVEASANSNDCIQCPPNSQIPSGLSGSQEADCVRRPGHSETTCVPCPPGTCKNINRPSICQVCPTNSYSSSPGSTVCSDCHANSIRSVNSTSADACVCVAGFGAALVNDWRYARSAWVTSSRTPRGRARRVAWARLRWMAWGQAVRTARLENMQTLWAQRRVCHAEPTVTVWSAAPV